MKASSLLTTLVVATSSWLPALAVQAQEMCGPDSGVYVCGRETQFGVGNHSYLWNAQNGEACGRSQVSGAPGNVSRYESGPGADSCNFVPLSEGREADIMNYCKNHANEGQWVPFTNDCHNSTSDSVTNNGLSYPGTPGGRIGDRDYSSSDSPGWMESAEDNNMLYTPSW
jgi:hypothetical protein